MHNIENDAIKISVKSTGAELASLYNKKTATELLWQGDATYWSGQAPILFPIVGGLKNNSYIHNDKTYQLNRHGFARRSTNWKIEKIDNSSIQCTLTHDKSTLEVYPFEFTLVVNYTLVENTLVIEHHITNNGNEVMPFSIGGHPAFNCPSDKQTGYNDYFLKFETKETVARHFLNEEGLLNGETKTVLNETDKLQLSKDLFKNDALIFKNLKSDQVSLYQSDKKILSVKFENFPFLGIWAAPNAPFVCIEPWIGHADKINSNQNLYTKEGSKSLLQNETFTVAYQISIA
ncbi:aldose 1-epimerase family protein [Aquimarina agarivorans]|uniref:aldose 1-epimerase family protein n=1 Tax=Aquimarina agarivorans TaxID=980584 RepID=UPI000248EB1D|nr:aldose 1-epimerase family protein [Aquimarina agarivorans]